MAVAAGLGHNPRIDASELNWVEVTEEGRRVCLHLRDGMARPASVSLPVDCLNKVLSAVPRTDAELLAAAASEVHDLDSWSLDQTIEGSVLTLHLPEGSSIAFRVKPSQIVAMASLAGLIVPHGRRFN